MKFITAALDDDYEAINEVDKAELKRWLFLLEHWSNGSLALLANCMSLYTIADIRPLVQSVFRQAGRRRTADRDRDTIIMAIALNFAEKCIQNNNDEACAAALAIVASYPPVPQTTFYKLVAAYYQALLDFRQSPTDEKLGTIQTITVALNAGGLAFFADNLNNFFDTYSKNNRDSSKSLSDENKTTLVR
ncbi:ABC transporter C-terminal domain-containing protein [Sporolactobacillus spathodeae]